MTVTDDADLYENPLDVEDEPGDLYEDEGGEEAPIYTSQEEERPQPIQGRESLAPLAMMVWAGAGMALQRSGIDPPVGRVLAFQAPMAGAKIDEAIQGTFLDGILQPLATAYDKAEGIGALVALPLLVAIYERAPNTAPIVYPLLRQSVEATLVEMAPLLKKQQAKNRKAAQAMQDLSPLFAEMNLPKGEDPIDTILWMLLNPDAKPEEEDAGATS